MLVAVDWTFSVKKTHGASPVDAQDEGWKPKEVFPPHFSFFYLEWTDAEVAESREIQPGILMDAAAQRLIGGIEVLDGSQRAARPLKTVA
jgi:uncharacterized protein YuzE